MSKASWMAVLGVSLLVANSAFAQGIDAPDPEEQETRNAELTADLLQAEVQYSDLWDMRYPVELTTSTDNWPASISEVDFQDASLSARMSQLRNLSLLTIAEFGKRRLFLGVNDEGLVGIHFLGFSGSTDQQYMEVVRMPYLGEDTTPGNEDPAGAVQAEPRQAAPNH